MPILTVVLIGALVGAHASTWGMYKDAPHEGFSLLKYLRSTILAAAIAPFVATMLDLVPSRLPGAMILFGCVYAGERAVLETWKTFFREEDQSKYAIPMQLAVFGRTVKRRPVRLLFGVLYLGAIIVGVLLISRLRVPPATPSWLLAITIGAMGGWFSAFGGAWKDAPIEGFQIFKFFRSPLIAATWAWVLYLLGATPAQGMLGAIGYTVATTETWKTFFYPSVPRGKFAGKPVLFPEMLRTRQYFIPLYAGIWALLLLGFALAFFRRA